MFSVDVLICIPLPSQKWWFLADDFSIEEGGQRGIFYCESFDLEVPTQIGVLHVDVLQTNTDQHSSIQKAAVDGYWLAKALCHDKKIVSLYFFYHEKSNPLNFIVWETFTLPVQKPLHL